MSSTSMSPELHPDFYFDDNLVVIQVENTLFRVHKFQLNKSETFSNMFKMPQGPAKDPEEGASREHPIVLEGVKASDFAALIKVLYAFRFSSENIDHETDILVPAFRLAHMWDFSDLRAQLLLLLKESLGSVDRIVVAREVGLQEWLAPAYLELCLREELPTMGEAGKLGMHSVMMLFRLRARRTGIYCADCMGAALCESGVAADSGCDQCGEICYSYYHYRAQDTLAHSRAWFENEIIKWIEGGCVTE